MKIATKSTLILAEKGSAQDIFVTHKASQLVAPVWHYTAIIGAF